MGEQFSAVEIIIAKRDGGVLSDAQIDWVIDAYTRGAVADEQMAALAMAVLLRGLTPGELARWTAAMIASGERLDLSAVARPTADKHSTGGVGDKITLPLAPLVAACGAAVPQLSGRGLGHTGGTLDKLESIAGWRASVSNADFVRQLNDVGAVVCAAGDGLAPADRKLYSLRDVTGTVESIPLIASSIMSKKIAEGSHALVLDVKVGTGAFMKSLADARRLAETMVELGTAHGVNTVALLTGMDVPLGRTAGNALEVAESVEVLAGGGPSDVIELTLALAREMLTAAGIGTDPADALRDGRAMDVWRRMIAAQGGDPSAPLPTARERHVVTATDSGVLTKLDAMAVGTAVWRLGAGRARKEDSVSFGAGVVMLAKPGDTVVQGEPLLELHADDAARFARALEALDGGIEIGASYDAPALVLDRVSAGALGPALAWGHADAPLDHDSIRSAPKVLLHDHLDGGVRPRTVLELATEIGYDGLPATEVDALDHWFRDASDSGSLVRYLETFAHTVAVMQTREGLTRVAREAAEDLADDGVVYAEIRWAPEQHTEAGLSLEEVVDAVLAGFAEGRATAAARGKSIRVGAIATAMRHAARSREIAELAVAYRDRGVVGFDIAGAEAGFPPTRHLDAFEYLRRENYHFTIHAGEAFGLPSIWEAIQWCGTDRLGHGVRIVDDIGADGALGRLAQYVRDKRIPLEMCPSSNVQTGAAVSIAEHPIGELRRRHFRVTVNTDNRLMSGTSMTREMSLLVQAFDYDWYDLQWFTLNAMKSAFIPFDDRLDLINNTIKPGYAALMA